MEICKTMPIAKSEIHVKTYKMIKHFLNFKQISKGCRRLIGICREFRLDVYIGLHKTQSFNVQLLSSDLICALLYR